MGGNLGWEVQCFSICPPTVAGGFALHNPRASVLVLTQDVSELQGAHTDVSFAKHFCEKPLPRIDS